MKKTSTLKFSFILLTLFIGVNLLAQDEFILDPAQLIPADTGYYIGGVWKDLSDPPDGVPEFYNQCYDAYGDANHNESGTQQGFTYVKCMIMPTCTSKHPETTIVKTGYIEIGKTKYVGTDSARLCYIISPAIMNLTEIYLEVSPDVEPNDQRHIWYYIDYSTDGGETWVETTYIQDETLSKDGDLHTYDGSLYYQFDEMKTASQAGPILLRLMSGEQRVKVHYYRIKASEPINNSVIPIREDRINFKVYENTIFANHGKVVVYNLLGQIVGRGESVYVPDGIFIIKTSDGIIHKVYVK